GRTAILRARHAWRALRAHLLREPRQAALLYSRHPQFRSAAAGHRPRITCRIASPRRHFGVKRFITAFPFWRRRFLCVCHVEFVFFKLITMPNLMHLKNPPLKIGSLLVDPPILQAPMAGFTNYAYRQIVRQFGGAGLQATEMISAKGFLSQGER